MAVLTAFLILGLASGAAPGAEESSLAGDPAVRVPLVPVAEGGKAQVLTTGRLWGRLLDNQANTGRQGSGFNPLVHLDYPSSPIFRVEDTGLNFEHIFNGAAADHDLAMFTPRVDPVTLVAISATSAMLHWPAESSAWGIDASMTYRLSAPDTLDMEFQLTPTRDRFPLGYVACMWASYMNAARDRRIHFYGTDQGEERWVSFGDVRGDGTVEMGTVSADGLEPLPFEEGAQTLNVVESTTKHFVKPFYYGLIDGDQDVRTEDDTLAYVIMFDQKEPIRFAMWNFIADPQGKPNPRHPAWDWQYVVRNPKPGQTYGYRARLTIRAFENREQIEELYQAWVARGYR